MAQVEEQITEIIAPLLDELAFELVDLEYKREQRGWVLRFYLDKEGGINLDDCAIASREISTLLDVEDLIPTAYTLEVSSPGIERPLKKLSDFERFSGQPVKIKTLQPLEFGKHSGKTFQGQLAGVEGDVILLTLADKEQTQARIPFSSLDKANLVFEF